MGDFIVLGGVTRFFFFAFLFYLTHVSELHVELVLLACRNPPGSALTWALRSRTSRLLVLTAPSVCVSLQRHFYSLLLDVPVVSGFRTLSPEGARTLSSCRAFARRLLRGQRFLGLEQHPTGAPGSPRTAPGRRCRLPTHARAWGPAP